MAWAGLFLAAWCNAADLGTLVAGKSGVGLAAALRKECRPKTLETHTSLPQGQIAWNIVPSQWWSANHPYGDTLRLDRHNIMPLPPATASLIAELPAGILCDTLATNGDWATGHGTVYGSKVDLYAPPAIERGHIARSYLYMALMYPEGIYTPRGMMVMDSGEPHLSSYWRSLCLEWARCYAPSAAEIEWNETASEAQGSANPLIVFPGIEDYIWGGKTDEAYQTGDDPIPLHSSYHLDTDMINLFSPSIPADAAWAIDGVSVSAGSFPACGLGVGKHHLVYKSASTGETGRLMINVAP